METFIYKNFQNKLFELINIHNIVKKTKGNPQIKVGILDGPADLNHFALKNLRIKILGNLETFVKNLNSGNLALMHGTSILGILAATNNKYIHGIVPNCSFIINPVFLNNTKYGTQIPITNPKTLANSILEIVDAGAKIINISAGISTRSIELFKDLKDAYRYAMNNDAIIITSAGNQANAIPSSLFGHPWIIPVGACDHYGRFNQQSNYGISMSYNGLMAPGSDVITIAPENKFIKVSGTSIACPFVTGTISLIRSLYPKLSSSEIKFAIFNSHKNHTSIPKLLNAEKIIENLQI